MATEVCNISFPSSLRSKFLKFHGMGSQFVNLLVATPNQEYGWAGK
uniref:Uncharacterized protein n=1 Tax=Arundo donax TaxID=35708 RepID=A0A0A8ZTD5_ARUDO